MDKTKAVNRRKINTANMIIVGLVVSMLLLLLLYQGYSLKNRISVYDNEIASMKAKVEEESLRTQEIDALKDYMETDEYAEELAREKLGMVKDDEIVFMESDDTGN